MQFTMDAWAGISARSITVTFRTWRSQRVYPGRSYRVAPGMVRVIDVSRVPAGSITRADAAASGATLESLRERLGVDDDAEVWRIEFAFDGLDPLVALRDEVPVGDELDAVADSVLAIDDRSRNGPWAVRTLELLNENPAVRAPDLAASLGEDTLRFKQRVRRLKRLGLTESLRVGYRLSPRGEAVLDAIRRRA